MRLARSKRILALLVFVVSVGATPAAISAQQPRAPAQEGFVPVDQLPPDEKLPAAPLLIAAYAIAWVVVLVYLWSIWQRLSKVERELADVGRRIEAGGRR
jgi:CcmD family protein